MSKASNLRLGVIGLGVGEQHLKGYQHLPNVKVTAVADLDLEHAQNVVKRHQLENIFITTDANQLLDRQIVDAVSICSYDNHHAAQAIRAFTNGIHVMLEKPAVLYREELHQLTKAWQNSGKVLSSNLILRASPRFAELKSRIEQQELGEIFYIEGDYLHNILWKLSEGWRGKMPFYSVIYGGGVHLIDLMRFLLNQEIVEVCAMGSNIMSRTSPYKFDDTIVSLLRFENNILAKCSASFSSYRPQLHALNVFGSQGTWHNDTPDGKMFLSDKPNSKPIIIDKAYPGITKYALLGSFVASICENNAATMVSGEDVIRTMDVCLTISDALNEKRTLPVNYTI